jgi:acyl-CoA synthetase (AMP-forming)/AMP-acid ligase II
MNAVQRAAEHARHRSSRLALRTTSDGAVTFGELFQQAARIQRALRAQGIHPGDSVLVAVSPSAALFAAVLAVAGLGACTVLVEPWMPARRIEHVVSLVTPKLFLANLTGRLWGIRMPAVRRIRTSISPRAAMRVSSPDPFHVEELAPDSRAIVTFSSGTSGVPKGVVRTHGYLRELQGLLERGEDASLTGPDLTVFANVVLFHLATGRGSILVPSSWSPRELGHIADLPRDLQPHSLACGPAFLRRLLEVPGFASLRSMCVGGALTDCWILERALGRWPDARWTHIYGGTEAEPVALADARCAVALSRARGYFQTIFLGMPIPEVRTRVEPDGLWVTGPNVCGEYVGSPTDNERMKHRDAAGGVWHFMGDRVEADAAGWWYAGRSFQRLDDFRLEQSVYAFLQSSACFVHRTVEGDAYLVGEGIGRRAGDIRRRFPDLVGVIEASIVRDRRHRARVDRAATLGKEAPWLAG